jgi:cadmium resistance protein CadD (predicted permease)
VWIHSQGHWVWALRHADDEHSEDETVTTEAQRWRSPVLTVATVTVANGGDNLSIYIPVFANAPSAIPLYALVFAVMTGLWCLLSERLVNHPRAGALIRHYGDIALPFVLILLGLSLLSGAF